MQDYRPYLETALRAAEAASEVLREAAATGPAGVQTKADQTPVTDADFAAERSILDVLRAEWPDHEIWSEESGASRTDAEWLWLVDPLDGTRGYVRRTPFFSSQIALMHRGRVVAGVSSAPLFEETFSAVRGGGAWCNGEPISVSSVGGLRDATVSSGNLRSLAADARAWSGFGELIQRVERIRGYGDFCSYHLLARGALDVVIESDVGILDVAALSLIVEEAGGTVTQLDGRRLGLESTDILATNGRLQESVARVLAGGRD